MLLILERFKLKMLSHELLWGEGKPLALLSMSVRLLRRLTDTALRAAFRSLPSPQAPIPSPARFYRGKSQGHEATPPPRQAERVWDM